MGPGRALAHVRCVYFQMFVCRWLYMCFHSCVPGLQSIWVALINPYLKQFVCIVLYYRAYYCKPAVNDEPSWSFIMLNQCDASWCHDASWLIYRDTSWWVVAVNHSGSPSRCIVLMHCDEPSWFIMMSRHDAPWWIVMHCEDSSWWIRLDGTADGDEWT